MPTALESYYIKEVGKEDNTLLSKMIKRVLVEMGVPKQGTAYADASLNDMYHYYNGNRARYFVVWDNDKIVGGGGIAPLQKYEHSVCELQKMYFLKEARGKGLGQKLIEECLFQAKRMGYEKCYLETMPAMVNAQKLYLKNGFEFLDGPLGDTKHYSCSIWMIKTL